MKSLVVLIVALCGVSLAKHIVNPLADDSDATFAEIYELCANSSARCVSENSTCIEAKNCENLIVIESDEDAGFAYHLLTTGHEYIAIGFSQDQAMGTEMVISCQDTDGNGTITGVLSHNEGKKNIVEESQDELTVSTTKKEDTTMYCKFTLKDTLGFARKSDNGSDTEYYVVGVSGKLQNALVGHHGHAFISGEKWSFGPSDNSDATFAEIYELCANSSARCVSENSTCIEAKNCENLIVIESDEDAGFAYHMLTTGHEYIAIGFSQDQAMGTEMVISCQDTDSNGTIVGVLSHNEGRKNIVEESQDELTVSTIKKEDTTMYCKFTLKDTLGFARKSDNGSDTEYYVVGVSGKLRNGLVSHHGDAFMTEEKWAFASSAATITSSLLLAIFATLINLRS